MCFFLNESVHHPPENAEANYFAKLFSIHPNLPNHRTETYALVGTPSGN
jgi:hypothetical protein